MADFYQTKGRYRAIKIGEALVNSGYAGPIQELRELERMTYSEIVDFLMFEGGQGIEDIFGRAKRATIVNGVGYALRGNDVRHFGPVYDGLVDLELNSKITRENADEASRIVSERCIKKKKGIFGFSKGQLSECGKKATIAKGIQPREEGEIMFAYLLKGDGMTYKEIAKAINDFYWGRKVRSENKNTANNMFREYQKRLG